MKLVIQGKNIEITDSINHYVHQKIEKAISHFKHLTNEVDVNLSVARNHRITPKQSAEITLYIDGAVVRAEESSENLYASIDLVASKITRQLRRYKEKRNDRSLHSVNPLKEDFTIDIAPIADVDDVLQRKSPQLPEAVVRSKYFAMPPMSVQEALEHLELVDHDFYMFLNAETDSICVIYERNHGGYGLLQPRLAGDVHTKGQAAHRKTKLATLSHAAAL
ncbi:MAG: ribosome hibernation-promoting factor, HPF/YfiA family [Leptolyngbyaceae cyanobacterium]